MAFTSQSRSLESDDLPREFVELGRQIASLPEPYASQLDTAYRHALEAVGRRRRILSLVQEALAQLRLDIKYLIFDREVTRRERDELRSQLGDVDRDW